VKILGVSFDNERDNKAFAEKYKFPFPLLCDTERKIGVAYGAADSTKDEYARRIAYLIDEQGKVAQAHPKVEPAAYPSWQLRNL
jgi:thioredoxin-dependent peroxiredoxin